MRRSASEIINELETRIARLEKQSAYHHRTPAFEKIRKNEQEARMRVNLHDQKDLSKFVRFCEVFDLKKAGDAIPYESLPDYPHDLTWRFIVQKNQFGVKGLKFKNGELTLTREGEAFLKIPLTIF